MRQFPKFVGLHMLRGYKWAISPLLPPACRFVPTCSEYAQEAVERYGALRGMGMAAMMLLRCHPFSRGGYDPVEHHHSEMFCERLTANDQRPTTATRAI